MSNEKIRVLVVDDSFFMRRLLRELLSREARIEVVGEARDGEEAVAKSVMLSPQVITMDYNLPKLNGASATREIIAKVSPKPAILMISAYTKEGSEETLDSLSSGALDYVCKPSGELSLDIDKVGEEIIQKVRALAGAASEVVKEKKIEKVPEVRGREVEVIVIGSSTGGPPVVEQIVSKLPKNYSKAVVVAQHMPSKFTASFAKRLDKLAQVEVREAEAGLELVPGRVVLGAGEQDLELVGKGRLQLTPAAGMLSPSIDKLFASAAKVYGAKVLGIVLSGMGEDGCKGAAVIKEAGGQVWIQDPAQAVVRSMPREVERAGLADETLMVEGIVAGLVALST